MTIFAPLRANTLDELATALSAAVKNGYQPLGGPLLKLIDRDAEGGGWRGKRDPVTVYEILVGK